MKAIKSLLAVSVLAAAGAQAATIETYTASESATSIKYKGTLQLVVASKPHSTTGTPVSTASLDDSGVLTVDIFNFHFNSLLGTDSFTDSVITLNGTWNGTSFTAATGSETKTGCTNGPNDGTNHTCSSVPLNTAVPFTTVSGSATAGSGGSGSFTLSLTQADGTKSDYSLTLSGGQPVSSVPVPAAAWLFGSGLLGLAGTARRRRAV